MLENELRSGNKPLLKSRGPAFLTMNWQDVCEDKSLADLPYKIELNRQGQIIMSPTRNKRGFFQAEIAILLKKLLPHGFVLTECAIDTPEGIFVASGLCPEFPAHIDA